MARENGTLNQFRDANKFASQNGKFVLKGEARHLLRKTTNVAEFCVEHIPYSKRGVASLLLFCYAENGT